MRIRIFLLAFLLGVISLSGAKAATYDEIMQRGNMVVAVYRDFPPFSYRQGENVVGIDVEVAKAVCQRMGLKAIIREQTAGETVSDDLRNVVWKGHYLEHNTADMMLHIPVDRDFMLSNSEAAIFAPYFRDRLAVVTDPEQISSYQGLDDFFDHKVGVEMGSLADQYLLTIHDGKLIDHVVHYRGLTKAVDGLFKKDVAGVMGVRSEIEGALSAQDRKYRVVPMTLPGLFNGEWVLGMAVKSSNRQLANAVEDVVAALIADGTIPAIFKSAGLAYIPAYEKQ